MQYDALLKEVLQLTPDQRGDLAARLLESLEEDNGDAVDAAAWEAELRKRLADPNPELVDADAVIDELESDLDAQAR